MRKRIIAFGMAIVFLFILLIVRLSFVQIVNGEWLQAKAVDQWTRGLSLTAERGKIYDTTGSVLAVSYTTYDLYARAREITDAPNVAVFLTKTLDLDYSNVLQKLQTKNVSEVLIKMQIDETLAKQISSANLDGLYLTENIKRYYPYGDLLTQVLGFTTIDNIGQAGIEAFYDQMLKGLNGKFLTQSDLTGAKLDNSLVYYLQSVPGMNIELTIDSKIQLVVEKVLQKIMDEQKAKSVTCIVMQPNTGEILSLSIKPSFDLNDIPRDNVLELMTNVKNKAVVDVYEPGSTFKILTTSSALEEKLTNLNDKFYDPGYRIVDGQRIKCWKTIGHGSQNLVDGLCNSCNSVFMDLALRLGTQRFYQYLKNFGIGAKTNVEISGESSGILMKQKNVKNVDLARIGFGQAVAVTPLQLITAFCCCVNGGKLMQPYLVKSIKSNFDEVVLQSKPTTIRQVVSATTSNSINQMLEAVVTKQGKTTFVAGYDIGGKTGTAQKYENGIIAQGKYVSSFFGTYPAQNPEYAVLLLVDEPGAGAYYGSVVAAPYAKEIFSGIFEYKNILPQDLQAKEALLVQDIEMPNLIGLSLANACSQISKLGLSYELDGEGGIVTSQYPTSGVKLAKYQTVVIGTT